MLDKVGADPEQELRRMQLLVDEEQLKVGFVDAEPFDPEYCFCGDKSPGVAQCESCLAWVHPGCDGVDEPKRIFASPNPYYCAQCGYLHLLYKNVSFPLLLLEPEQLGTSRHFLNEEREGLNTPSGSFLEDSHLASTNLLDLILIARTWQRLAVLALDQLVKEKFLIFLI